MIETLNCGGCGKDFTREAVRGRKPTRCPDCKPQGASVNEIAATPFTAQIPNRIQPGATLIVTHSPAQPDPYRATRTFYGVLCGYGPLWHRNRLDTEAQARTEAARMTAQELPPSEGGEVYRACRIEILD